MTRTQIRLIADLTQTTEPTVRSVLRGGRTAQKRSQPRERILKALEALEAFGVSVPTGAPSPLAISTLPNIGDT
jgi:hypothetical protein